MVCEAMFSTQLSIKNSDETSVTTHEHTSLGLTDRAFMVRRISQQIVRFLIKALGAILIVAKG